MDLRKYMGKNSLKIILVLKCVPLQYGLTWITLYKAYHAKYSQVF